MPTLDQLPEPPMRKIGWPWNIETPQLPDSKPNDQPWPKISIVTPSYNQAQFLEETIRSVLLQGYPNLEYIIIDGGSTDGSLDIIKKYNKWLKYWISEPDKGQSDAINKGLKKAEGEILAWLNSDDIYCPNSLQIVSDFFIRNIGVDLLYGSSDIINSDGNKIGAMKSWSFNPKKQLTGRNLIIQPSTFFRNKVINTIGYLNINLKYVMDYEYWVRVILSGFKVVNIPTTLSTFRFHNFSKTVSEQLLMRKEIKVVLDYIYKYKEGQNDIKKLAGRAYSTYHRSLGEYFFTFGQKENARKEFWQVIKCKPFRLTTLIVLAFIIDTWLGTKLGFSLQRLRWKLPDVPKGDFLLDDLYLKSFETDNY